MGGEGRGGNRRKSMVRVGGDLSLTLPNNLIWGREEEEKWEG